MATNNAWNANYTKAGTYTPALTFGGGSTGLTYTVQTGNYIIIGTYCLVIISITINNKGSSTGNASITLPVTSTFDCYGVCGAGSVTYTGQTYAAISGAALTIVNAATASALTTLTDTAFINGSAIRITAAFPWAG